MMTLERFRELAQSYGADLQRWPQDEVSAARELLARSEDARVLLEQERQLDKDIAEAGSGANAAGHSANAGQEEQLARLRAGVAARISEGPAPRRVWSFGWWGLIAGGAAVIAAGVFVGAMYDKPPQPDGVLSLLLVDDL